MNRHIGLLACSLIDLCFVGANFSPTYLNTKSLRNVVKELSDDQTSETPQIAVGRKSSSQKHKVNAIQIIDLYLNYKWSELQLDETSYMLIFFLLCKIQHAFLCFGARSLQCIFDWYSVKFPHIFIDQKCLDKICTDFGYSTLFYFQGTHLENHMYETIASLGIVRQIELPKEKYFPSQSRKIAQILENANHLSVSQQHPPGSHQTKEKQRVDEDASIMKKYRWTISKMQKITESSSAMNNMISNNLMSALDDCRPLPIIAEVRFQNRPTTRILSFLDMIKDSPISENILVGQSWSEYLDPKKGFQTWDSSNSGVLLITDTDDFSFLSLPSDPIRCCCASPNTVWNISHNYKSWSNGHISGFSPFVLDLINRRGLQDYCCLILKELEDVQHKFFP